MKVLIVEDNSILSERIGRQFVNLASVDYAYTGAEAIDKASDAYTVIVLDLGLPDMSGLAVCNKVRGSGIEAPILVLTAESDISSRVTLLNAGADDYLMKPFHGEELIARVKALARRKPRELAREEIEIADLTLNEERRTAMRDGKPIYLTRTEFNILEYLIRFKGRVITRAMIYDRVWPNDSTTGFNVVDVHIKRLRDKIDRPFSYPLIHTAHGLGYVVDVR